MRPALLLALAAGCLQPGRYFDGLRDPHADPDGDGWTAAQGDCAPADPTVAPHLPEVCDGKDNDCDGAVDEEPVDAEAWYDGDGDGYGDPSASVAMCRPPEGFVAAGAPDCDDGSALSFPGADERCDGADNDCDGLVDEDPAIDAPTWYLDVDADGFGAASDPVTSCAPPSEEWVLNGDDCAPTDPLIHPDAVEICNGEDDDCDGLADNPPVVGDTLWYPDEDGDGYGDLNADGRCEPEPGWVDNRLDCGDDDPAVRPGAAEVCNDGLDNDCSGLAEGCAWPSVVDLGEEIALSAEAGTAGAFGSGLGVADIDGDGRRELLLGDYGAAAVGGGAVGAVHVLPLPITASTTTAGAAAWRARDPLLQWFGVDLGTGDLDGDGYTDIISGSVRAAGGGGGEGAVFIAYGPLPIGGGIIEDHFDWTLFYDGLWTEYYGRSTELVGDVSGDGLPDIAVGASHHGRPNPYGAVFLYTALGTGTGDARRAAGTIITSDTFGQVGWCITSLDLNADGLNDLVVSAPYHLDNGAGLVFLGPVPAGELLADEADVTVVGRVPGGRLGEGCAAVGDPNGDGYAALALSADVDGRGWAGVFDEGLGAGLHRAADAPAQLLGTAAGSGGAFGASLHPAGDLNQDGVPDLVVGENGRGPLAARVWFGPFAGTEDDTDADVTLWLPDPTAGGYLRQLLGGEDLTGDTVPDLLVASEIGDGGRAWIAPGVGF